jgi:hypothetical protein
MARQGSPQRLGARPYASPCGLAAPSPPSLRVAIASTRGSRRVPAVSVASPGLHGSGKALRLTSAPCAPLRSPSWNHARLRFASAPSSRLRRFLSFLQRCAPIGWGGAAPPWSFGLVLAAARFHPFSVLSVPSCRSFYLFGGGGFGSSSRGRRCGRRHGSRCPCLPSGGAPTPRPRSPAPFGRALPTVGLRGERLKPFFSATRSQCQTWLVSSTKPQRRGLNGSLGTPNKPCLTFLRHYRHRLFGDA